MKDALLQPSTEGQGFWHRQARKNLAAESRAIRPAESRTLKIEATGDFAAGKITPKIRLTGQWLEQAGFKPGHRVEVWLDEPGKITLSFAEQATEATR